MTNKWVQRAASRVAFLAWVAVSLAFAYAGIPPWRALGVPAPDAAKHGVTTVLRSGSTVTRSQAATILLEEVNSHKKKDNPLLDCAVGLFLLPMSIALLWLNEGHVVRINDMIKFLRRKVKIVQASQASELHLRCPMFVTGTASTDDTLTLKEWGGLTAPGNSAKLRVRSFMFQWEEETEDNKVNYTKKWAHHRINSETFQKKGYDNPDFPVSPTNIELAKVTAGGFVLSMKMLGKLQNYQTCPLNDEILSAISASPRMVSFTHAQKTTFRDQPAHFFARGAGNLGRGPGMPHIGDLMVIFDFVPCGPISVLGVQVPCAEHHGGKLLVPGTRCEVSGRAAEISEESPPPRPFQVHYTQGAQQPYFEWVEADDIQPTKAAISWSVDPACPWTFAPVQFTCDRSSKFTYVKANTRNINVGDEAHQTLLGENETDLYIEDVRSVSAHLRHGVDQVLKSTSWNPVSWAQAFLSGSSPDEICLAFPEKMTFEQAMEKEKELERKVNNMVRVFGMVLMWVSFMMIMSPLTWLLSFLWIVGGATITLLKLGACLVTCMCSGCTMASAWAWYRPHLMIPLVCALLGLFYLGHLDAQAA